MNMRRVLVGLLICAAALAGETRRAPAREPLMTVTLLGTGTPILNINRFGMSTLVQAGMLSSLTAGSLVGRFGRTVQRFALELASEGLMHNVASDAPDHLRRPPGIADELKRSRLDGLREWLTEAVPEAILADREDIPAPPEHPAGARLRSRRRWRR